MLQSAIKNYYNSCCNIQGTAVTITFSFFAPPFTFQVIYVQSIIKFEGQYMFFTYDLKRGLLNN